MCPEPRPRGKTTLTGSAYGNTIGSPGGLHQFHLTAPSEIGLGMRSGLVVRAHDKIAAPSARRCLRSEDSELSDFRRRADLCVVPRRIRYSLFAFGTRKTLILEMIGQGSRSERTMYMYTEVERTRSRVEDVLGTIISETKQDGRTKL